MKKRSLYMGFAALFIVVQAQDVHAESSDTLSSNWVMDEYTKSRLFVGGYDKEKKILHLGWHISLKSGWKTYWCSPGDAGLPPRWTWKNTKNIQSIKVSWPRPERLHIFDMDTFIYHDEVILPIEMKLKDGGDEVSVNLDLEYMIYEEICVPAEASYKFKISNPDDLNISIFQKAKLDHYKSLVPVKRDKELSNISIQSIEDGKGLLIELPDEMKQVNDIVVARKDGILLSDIKKRDDLGEGKFILKYPMDEKVKKEKLTFTFLRGDQRAIEMDIIVFP